MSEEENIGNNNTTSKREYKILIKNTFYSYLNMYGTYILSLVTSFIIARSITQELWGYLILSISIIALITNILSFFPPSLSYTLAHYIPRFQVEKEYGKLKSFIKYALYQRLFFALIFFIVSLLIILFVSNLFSIILGDYIYLLIIIAPLIIKRGITQLYTGINQGFNQFKLMFYLMLVGYGIYIGGLLFYFFVYNSVSLQQITVIYFFSEIVPAILNTINVSLLFSKIPSKSKPKYSLYQTFRMIIKYGGFVAVDTTISNEWIQLEFQFIKMVESAKWVTGYSIASNYFSVTRFSLSSFSNPLIVSFSRLDYKKNFDQLKKVFEMVLYYSSFFFMLLNGIFYFCADFFLAFFYGPSYLIFSNMLKLLLVMSIFRILGPQFVALLQGTNKVKFLAKISILNLAIKAPIALTGLILGGVIGLIIGNGIGYIIVVSLFVYLSYKIFDIKLDIKKMVLQYIIFFIALIIANFLEFTFFRELNQVLVQNLHLISSLGELNIFSLITFILSYLFLNYLFKIFSKEDMEDVMKIFESKKKKNQILLKILTIIKKFLR